MITGAVPRQDNLRGIATMLAGICLFAGSDAAAKFMAATYPTGEIMLLRSIAPLLILLPFVWRDRSSLRVRPGLQVVRALLSTAEAACFFAAIARLPLADALTFYLAGPIFVTALSAAFLREHVGPWRWAAVLAGFAGVVVALDPSARSLDAASMIALAGSLTYAVLMIVTRTLRRSADSVLTWWQYVGGLLFGAVVAPGQWVPPPPGDLLLLCGFGVVSLAGSLCVNRSLRLADASVVVPYQYTIIVWATLNGWLFFGDVPRGNTLAGAAVIVAAGLFIAAREARRAQAGRG